MPCLPLLEAQHTKACYSQSPSSSGLLPLLQKSQQYLSSESFPPTSRGLLLPISLSLQSHSPALLLSWLSLAVPYFQVMLIRRNTGSLPPQETELAQLGLHSLEDFLCPSSTFRLFRGLELCALTDPVSTVSVLSWTKHWLCTQPPVPFPFLP